MDKISLVLFQKFTGKQVFLPDPYDGTRTRPVPVKLLPVPVPVYRTVHHHYTNNSDCTDFYWHSEYLWRQDGTASCCEGQRSRPCSDTCFLHYLVSWAARIHVAFESPVQCVVSPTSCRCSLYSYSINRGLRLWRISAVHTLFAVTAWPEYCSLIPCIIIGCTGNTPPADTRPAACSVARGLCWACGSSQTKHKHKVSSVGYTVDISYHT